MFLKTGNQSKGYVQWAKLRGVGRTSVSAVRSRLGLAEAHFGRAKPIGHSLGIFLFGRNRLGLSAPSVALRDADWGWRRVG